MMSNNASGHAAEQQAADYLIRLGFKILAINWKNRYGEIDIIAMQDKSICFVEVKSRKNSNQGFGLDYVTPKKIKQMQFAAEMWVNEQKWHGTYRLGAIGIDGEEITFVDSLDL